MFFLQSSPIDTAQIARVEDQIHDKIESLSHMSWHDGLISIAQWALQVGLKIVEALVIWYVGRWIIRHLKKLLSKLLTRRKVDPSLSTFFENLVSITLSVILIVIIIGVLGLNTTSFLALIASAGLALGLAISGTLQNFAGGVMVLLLRPFRVGDQIEAQGYSGVVKSIQLFNTVITTSDNKTILIPNGPISTGIINNVSAEPTRRVEWIIGIGYGDDFDKAQQVIRKILDDDKRVLKDRGYTIEIIELAASAVNIVVRCWVAREDFWPVFFDVNARIYKTLPAEGVKFPSSSMDVRLVDAQAAADTDSPQKGS